MEEETDRELLIGLLWLDNELYAPSSVFFEAENGYVFKDDMMIIAVIGVDNKRRYLLMTAQESEEYGERI